MGYFLVVIAALIGLSVVANSYVSYLAVIARAEERLALSQEETERMKIAIHAIQCGAPESEHGTLP